MHLPRSIRAALLTTALTAALVVPAGVASAAPAVTTGAKSVDNVTKNVGKTGWRDRDCWDWWKCDYGRGYRDFGFRGHGFRDFGFRDFGFRDFGFRDFGHHGRGRHGDHRGHHGGHGHGGYGHR